MISLFLCLYFLIYLKIVREYNSVYPSPDGHVRVGLIWLLTDSRYHWKGIIGRLIDGPFFLCNVFLPNYFYILICIRSKNFDKVIYFSTFYNMFVTYCLYSQLFDKIYVGYTSHLINRIECHNHSSTKGFTRSYRPWIVVYLEFHETKTMPLKREKQLKTSRGRDFVRNQINMFYKVDS